MSTAESFSTIELECGVTLELQSVRPMLLLDLLEGVKTNGDGQVDISSLSIRSLNGIMRYFCGWGVKNEIPQDQLSAVSIFGTGEHVQRSAWVRLVATEAELGEIFARVMALTNLRMNQPSAEQTELEKLRAENEQLKADKESVN
jgi:hypothetical protein